MTMLSAMKASQILLPFYREMFLLALEDAYDKFKSGQAVENRKINWQHVHAIIDSAEKWILQV
jgi:hypothetical protein